MGDNILYEYTDETGTLLYRQVRYYKDGKKSFYGEKLVEGEWVKGLKDVQRVLYKLPQVIQGIKKAESIYIVEGEKDVETLIKKGKVATTIAGGANQKWQPSFTDTLESANVIIIPDNDNPGQEFAMRIADSLIGKANTVKVLDLTKKWPDLKEKGDITDVFETVSNDSEVLTKLEELEKETSLYTKKQKKKKSQQKEFVVEELGLKLKVPKGYDISNENGIGKWKKDKDSGEQFLSNIIPFLILIRKILKNIDTGEEQAEVLFYRRGKWKSLIVNKNTLYNTQNIVSLANKGVLITSNNSKQIMEWLYALELENDNEIGVELTVNKMGWIDNKTFIPFRCNNVHLELEPGISTWLDKINKKKRNYR